MKQERGRPTCAEVRELLLEADLPQLCGETEDFLVDHLEGCSRCGEMARTILEGERKLGEVMEELVPAPDLEALLERATRDGASTSGKLRRRLRTAAPKLVPLAAAAALVALFLGREPALPGDPVSLSQPAPGLGLEVPEGRDVAVLATNNPDITVLWFF